MERHNREKEAFRELQAEMGDMKDQMGMAHAQHRKDRDEIDQSTCLYKVLHTS
jgi:hypothetical protein